MCADAHLEANPHSILVSSTPTSHVRLARNQAHPGYSLVILRTHETALTALDAGTLAAFWSDVQRIGRAIEQVYAPAKVDYLVMGHRMPHLHCHVFPQHRGDDPLRNVDISDGPVFLDLADMTAAVARLRQAWDSV